MVLGSQLLCSHHKKSLLNICWVCVSESSNYLCDNAIDILHGHAIRLCTFYFHIWTQNNATLWMHNKNNLSQALKTTCPWMLFYSFPIYLVYQRLHRSDILLLEFFNKLCNWHLKSKQQSFAWQKTYTGSTSFPTRSKISIS